MTTKYNIEGGINFYETLYKMLDENEIIEDDTKNQNLCLITNEPLTENYVTLECKHKFNYLPLFNDIKNHKKKFNSLETNLLKNNQIRCPYCRNKQNNLLPYYEHMGAIMKVIGVNVLPEPPPGYQTGICCFFESNYCSSNVMVLDLNNQTYCNSHFYLAKKKCIKDKIKKDKMDAKQKIKEDVKKAKEEEKQKAKEEKQKEKEEKLKLNEDAKKGLKNSVPKKKIKTINATINATIDATINATIDTSNKENENTIISLPTCSQMIKTGLNKGHQCKCKIYLLTMCKRHYNLFISKAHIISEHI